jgi:hypothetical protein
MEPSMRSPLLLATRAALLLSLLLAASISAQGAKIGFVEDFALAPDRQAVLDKLIPGSEAYYYYLCLERQHAGALGDVPELLEVWRKRHGRSSLLGLIENRQALLSFEKDPAATYRHLRERLRPKLDAERQSAQVQRELPTQLSPERLSLSRLASEALRRQRGRLSELRDSLLPALARADLSDSQLMELLRRLRRPDLPNLAALVHRNLSDRQSRGFGSPADPQAAAAQSAR